MRIFALCHERRNLAEYEGYLDVDEKLLEELLQANDVLLEKNKPTYLARSHAEFNRRSGSYCILINLHRI